MDKTVFDFHADDYAVSISASQDIIKLAGNGIINSISILPNMSAFDQAASMLEGLSPQVKKSVHLNFMEGRSCLPKGTVPDLVDNDSCFKVSWGSLLLASFNPIKRGRIKRQLADEIVAQVEKCIAAGLVEPGALRLDSHQHTHMIPLVRDALFDAIERIERQGRKVVFVRNTQDPLSIYFGTKGGLKEFSFANMLKCLILNWFSIALRRRLKERNLPIGYLCGVFYSGHMDDERLKKVLPAFEKLAIKKKCKVEVLFHPGSVKKEEITPEFNKPGFVNFHLSKNRHIEFNSICKLSGVSV